MAEPVIAAVAPAMNLNHARVCLLIIDEIILIASIPVGISRYNFRQERINRTGCCSGVGDPLEVVLRPRVEFNAPAGGTGVVDFGEQRVFCIRFV